MNPDDLYFDFCSGNGSLAFTSTAYDASCQTEESLVDKYVNSAAFVKAFHVNASLMGTWSPCTNGCGAIYSHDGGGMLPVYNGLFNSTLNLRILIYSGDVDMLIIPLASTRYCFAQLGRPVFFLSSLVPNQKK